MKVCSYLLRWRPCSAKAGDGNPESPDRQAVGGESVRRERQPVKHCKQAHPAPNAGAPAATGARSTRGGAKYVCIIAHYVTRLKERSGGRTESGEPAPAKARPIGAGGGGFFRTGCAIEKRKRPVLIPPCSRSRVNTRLLIQAMDLQTAGL